MHKQLMAMVRGRYIGTVLEAFATCDVKAGPQLRLTLLEVTPNRALVWICPKSRTQAPGYSDVEKR